ncbi:hypothetical protein TNIN_423411 [Trichonephila inaurata madagascariensis]|uniref:Uncharacterized protein n=1 Tax=Trichonephila inaurata madagascariensis TaxID=2747483 RepID=A0A8X6WRN9_9ARAC|nr:hypothetical protein TNIN_423411 [Trichonephila inaurata madagascariensis]
MIHLSQLTIVPANWAFPERHCIGYFLWPMVEQNPNLWFQQDGATAHSARTIRQLKQNIQDEILSLQQETYGVMENMLKRANLCIEKNGGHLSDVIFHI